ncbi:histone-lysine N-methyltransferase SETD2 isoform X2 [Python bivittatus]|uniref:[histone H3]-lysine(36) N-trimethyltransferase n=1 Tax=Python bivittatus TaxID=176946 RepID=A0A9F2R2G0_PYTBI|nr:histone-lysine N-methyltransferase SETD2 isoform X2 [Python bivittatus]
MLKDPSGHHKANTSSIADMQSPLRWKGTDNWCIFPKNMDGSEEVEREEENEGKTENVQKTGFVKGPVFKGVASSRFLPKGTRTKVNLEEQGRQKVSFSFSLTKKTLPNRFLTALGNEKQSESVSASAAPLQSDFASKVKTELGDTLGVAEEFSPPKPKAELGKIHFKKHLLNVTTKPSPTSAGLPVPVTPTPPAAAELGEAPSSPPPPPPPFPPPPPPPPQIKPAPTPVLIPATSPQVSVAVPAPVAPLLTSPVETIVRTTKEPPSKAPQETLELNVLQNAVLGGSEEHLAQVVSEEAEPVSVKRHSHIGKEEEIPDNSKGASLSSKKQSSRRKFSLSDGTLPGSESDEDSVRTSSSQRSHEIKTSANSEKEKDSRKSSASFKMEEQAKFSSRSRSERDEKYSSYSRSERDSRYSSSRSRSERERRRSRSHSRSRSERGSRTSSSYSRSERSHYYDSDRRYHRSSPYREKTRYSRSYMDSRARESSDSEEEYRRMYSRSTDSRHTSSHSSSYRDSRTSSSYSKSERESKTESTHTDLERRGKLAKSDRETRRTSESDVSKRCSPINELRHRRDASHSKAESSVSSSRTKSTSSKTSAPKSDKFKSSFCCTESEEIKDQSNCVDSETSCVQSCETKTAVTQKPETERTVSPLSQLNDSLTFRKLDESKTGSPISKMNELAGIDSHISIKEMESLVKVKHDQLRTCSPVELNINGSPEGRNNNTALSCTSEVEEIEVSSDDSLDRPEPPHQAKSPNLNKLPSNGIQMVCLPKGYNPADSLVFLGESNLLPKEKMEVSNPSEYECVSSCTKHVNHSKTLSKEVNDLTDSSCKTKDPIPCYFSDDAPVSLYYSEIEIEAEPSDTKATQESFMGIQTEIHTETFMSAHMEDQNPSRLAQESEKCTSFSSVEHTPARDFTTEEYFVEVKVDNQCVAQQQQTSENMFQLESPIQQKPNEVLTCPEVALELDILHADSIVEKTKSPFKNEHSYYLEMPVKEPEKEEQVEEKDSVPVDERVTSDLEKSPGVLLMRDKEDSLVESAFSDVLSPSCDIVVTVEETETIEEAPRYGSSSNTPEIFSVHNENYSDTAESASEQASDESETEDSDSDDSSVPRNRLQSVVVIPKNSTITMEESSSCSSRNSQSNRRYLDHWEDTRPESSKPFYEDMPDSLELNNSMQNESRGLPSRDTEGSSATSTELKRIETVGPQPDASQPQSDDVDSTSHSEQASDSFHKPDERIVLNETTSVTRSVGMSQGEELHYLSRNFEMSNTTARSQTGVSKSDRRQGRSAFAGLSNTADFSREDGFHSTEDLGNLGWDFSQPEKPSSTYQQPDSSYGVFPGYVYPPPAGPYVGSHNYWHDNGYWDPRLTSRPSAISYERIQGQVPDSLTEDHEEYEEVDRWVDESQLYFPDQSVKFQARDPREKGSVQGHEISSNSTKDFPVVRERKEPVNKVLEKNDMKERGPLKKRRTDLGSDSESDGGSQERKKVKAESEQLPVLPQGSPAARPLCFMEDFRDPQRWKECAKQGKMPCYFDLIEENVYLTERKKNKSHRDIKRMLCECPTLSKEERAQGEVACGEDCLNRLLMIECSSRCPNGEHCSNRRFQRKQHADVEVILTEKKGWGLRAAKDLPSNTFVLEYCGEVLDHKEFKTRVKEYARNKNIHYYFMALKNDEIIDATQKGNCSRFMNHSCEPNCETQKWTVNGQLRVGFFTTKLVSSGSELTFDYQFQRYGKEAQKCFCGSTNCRGYLGGENRVSIRAAGGKMKKERSRKKDSVDGELEALLENGEGLSDKNQVLSLSRLMVRIETPEQKLTCLKLIQMSSKRKSPSSAEGRSKKQRKAIDLNLKMKIIKAYDAGKKVNIIAREEGLAHSTISCILKDKERIREAMKGSPGTRAVITRQRKGLIHETEKLLMLWIEDQIQKRMPVGLLLIQAKARSIFQTLKERAGEECTETFTASRGWFMRFQRRFNYHSAHASGEAAGVEEVAQRFLNELDDIIAEGNYLPGQIFNVDETGLFWKAMPERTYIHREAQAMPGYKALQDRVTLLLGGNVAGFKLKPFLIHKSENPCAFKNIGEHTLPIYYRSNRKAWMTQVLFEDWFMNCFIPQVKEYCLQNRIPFKILLLLDNAPGHPPHLDDLHPDVKVVYLPQNTTPFLQPMDQGAVATFKAYYLHATFAKAVAAVEDKRVTVREFWKDYNILHCIKNIAAAWQDVTLKCMQGIWKKCLKRFAVLVNNFEGFDQNEDLDEINKKILTLTKSLDLEVDAEHVKNLIAYTEGELSNEDLIELKEELKAQRAEEEEEKEETLEVEPKMFSVKRLAGVFSEVNKILSELESMDPNVERFRKVHREIHKILKCYHEIYEEKKKNTAQSKLSGLFKTVSPSSILFPSPSARPRRSSAINQLC